MDSPLIRVIFFVHFAGEIRFANRGYHNLVCALCGDDFKFDVQRVKERQKAEMKALKIKHQYAKEMMKDQEIPKSMRTQKLNKMKREEKALRQKHEAELQDRRCGRVHAQDHIGGATSARVGHGRRR